MSILPQPPAHRPSHRARTALLVGLLATLPAPVRGHAVIASTRPTAGATATGRIEGTVVISTALSTRRPRFRIYTSPGPGANPPKRETNEILNVVLYLDGPVAAGDTAGDARAQRAARASITQEGERFVPHVLPVRRGATVDFPNADDVFHNVFSLSSAKTFDLGRYPHGSAKSVTFDESGIVQVFCHIHSDMSAVVLVLDNPHFTTPAPTGRFSLEDVPPGDYTVVGWHERIKPVTRKIHVTAGETARVDFAIPLPDGG
ncbi:MAG TPA: carboxypeptidase regulatory-like domain-containing protein [Gemmatimonadaceae bacterium]